MIPRVEADGIEGTGPLATTWQSLPSLTLAGAEVDSSCSAMLPATGRGRHAAAPDLHQLPP